MSENLWLNELYRRVEVVLPSEQHLLEVLKQKQKIKIYQGFDPTTPALHLGHLVGLLTLKLFQELGHKVIILIGDFTATFGNPSGKKTTRARLTPSQARLNAEGYIHQLAQVLDLNGPNPPQLVMNSQWLNQMTIKEALEIATFIDAEAVFDQPMFVERRAHHKPIHLHELLYPLLVTQDAMTLGVDVEVGGADILFNMQVGMPALAGLKNHSKTVLVTKVLSDEDGNKMSKTTGEPINLNDTPNEIKRKIELLPPGFLIPCLKLATTLPLEIIEAEMQKERESGLRQLLASALIEQLYGKNSNH